MLAWLENHEKPIKALMAITTALLTIAALIGIKVQLDGAARIQREQSARDIYREYLNLSVQKPEFAAPDYCALVTSNQFAAYQAYVDYLLYTGEQVLSVDPAWGPTIDNALEAHAAYFCAAEEDGAYPDADVQALVTKLQEAKCVKVKSCT